MAMEGAVTDQLEKFLQEADKLEKESKFSEALEKVNSALALDADHVRALTLGASCHISLGTEKNDSEAKGFYERAIKVQPDEGYEKYLGLAELNSGKEAVKLYEKGLELIKEERTKLIEDPRGFLSMNEDDLETATGLDELKYRGKEALLDVNSKIATILASLIEIYMVDLKDEPDSGAKGLELVTDAVAEFPEDPELHLLSSQLNASTAELSKAKEDLKLSVYHIIHHSKTPEVLKVVRGMEPERIYPLLQRIFEQCLSLKKFRLAKICLEEMRQLTSTEDPRLFALLACYHRLSALHHLRGVEHYGRRACEAVGAKEKACEIDDEDLRAKELCKDILARTPKKLPALGGAEGGEVNGNGNNGQSHEGESDGDESEFEDSDINEEHFSESDEDMDDSEAEEDEEDSEAEEEAQDVVEQTKALEKEGSTKKEGKEEGAANP